MSIAAKISQLFSRDVTVNKKVMARMGMSGIVDDTLKKTRVLGPRGAGRTAAINTGRGTGRRFISNNAYDIAHQARGRKIIAGGTAIGSAGFATSRRPGPYQNTGGYRGPNYMQSPAGVGRYSQ